MRILPLAVLTALGVTSLGLWLLFRNPEGPGDGLPRRLSQTGLYARRGARSPEALPFSPQYPLWTDGAEKARWIRLPPGTRIDASDPTRWRFPVGTKTWKEFRFAGRKVETRMLWLRAPDTWEYATYAWNEDQTEAIRVGPAGSRDHAPLPGGGHHSLPSEAECRTCHEGGRSQVLGFTALQLSPDRDPLAPHAEGLPEGAVTLPTLAAAGLLEGLDPVLLTTPPTITAGTPRGRASLGYLAANCAHCHQDQGPFRFLGLDLRADLAPARERDQAAWKTTVDVPPRLGIPGVPLGEIRRIKPGDPALSLLLYRLAPKDRVQRMPMLGSTQLDAQGQDLLRAWVEEDLKNP